MSVGKLKIAKLDEFIERELLTQLINASQRGEIAATISSCGIWNLPWALERGLLRSPIPDLLLLSTQDTIFLWQLGIRADNELEISSGFVRRLFARIAGNE
jgi:hypothetical protein